MYYTKGPFSPAFDFWSFKNFNSWNWTCLIFPQKTHVMKINSHPFVKLIFHLWSMLNFCHFFLLEYTWRDLKKYIYFYANFLYGLNNLKKHRLYEAFCVWDPKIKKQNIFLFRGQILKKWKNLPDISTIDLCTKIEWYIT